MNVLLDKMLVVLRSLEESGYYHGDNYTVHACAMASMKDIEEMKGFKPGQVALAVISTMLSNFCTVNGVIHHVECHELDVTGVSLTIPSRLVDIREKVNVKGGLKRAQG